MTTQCSGWIFSIDVECNKKRWGFVTPMFENMILFSIQNNSMITKEVSR